MRAILTLEHRGMVPRSYVLRLGMTYCIGRGRDATIRVDDEKASRRHVTVTLTPAGFELEEQGSRNGTVVDGRALVPHVRATVTQGVLEVGDARIKMELEQDPQDPRTRRLDNALPDLDDDFEVLGEIGQGATGRVYVARQKLLERTVAVKALKPQFVPGSHERARFLREGKLAARVRSPHVVEVFDVRLYNDRAYIIMELVQGPSAKDRVSKGALPLGEALRIGEDVARALAAAHDVAIVHRDVKPGNILINSEGLSKLADFGIAKDLDQSTISALTAAGDGLGTLAYVSPEQATDARKVDYRTDLYSLGATLYHLLCGRPPFIPTSARVLLDILDKPAPPLSAWCQSAPPDLCELVDDMLAKAPEDRSRSAHEVAASILEIRLRLGLVRSAGADNTHDGRAVSGEDGRLLSDRLRSSGDDDAPAPRA